MTEVWLEQPTVAATNDGYLGCHSSAIFVDDYDWQCVATDGVAAKAR